MKFFFVRVAQKQEGCQLGRTVLNLNTTQHKKQLNVYILVSLHSLTLCLLALNESMFASLDAQECKKFYDTFSNKMSHPSILTSP